MNGRTPGMQLRRRWCMLFALSLGVSVATAEDDLRLFDAHIHYNFNAKKAHPPEVAISFLDRAGIGRAIVSSTPNDGTAVLRQRQPERLIAFLRPYHRSRDQHGWSSERLTWFKDRATLAFIERELAKGAYRGIGEFHVNGDEVDTPVMRAIVDLAVSRNLWLMAHSDASAIEQLFSFNPGAKVIWAHTGMSEPEEVVARLFGQYPGLVGELSYRANITDANGLTAQWRELFLRYPDRFLYGSDTWVASRWPELRSLTAAARQWLGDLPRQVAEQIAVSNSERMFGR